VVGPEGEIGDVNTAEKDGINPAIVADPREKEAVADRGELAGLGRGGGASGSSAARRSATGTPGRRPGFSYFTTRKEAEAACRRIFNEVLTRNIDPQVANAAVGALRVFVDSKKFTELMERKVAERKQSEDLEYRLSEALDLVEHYGKRLEEIVASQRGNN
jgi:hypothetical protein